MTEPVPEPGDRPTAEQPPTPPPPPPPAAAPAPPPPSSDRRPTPRWLPITGVGVAGLVLGLIIGGIGGGLIGAAWQHNHRGFHGDDRGNHWQDRNFDKRPGMPQGPGQGPVFPRRPIPPNQPGQNAPTEAPTPAPTPS